MSKETILVFSDLHFSCIGRDNRVDLMQEQMMLKSCIMRLCSKYDNPIVVLLGDVFDRGFRVPHRLGEEMSFFVSLAKKVKSIYSVVGNHEITYYANNPFWNLVTEVHSCYLNNLSKNTAPLGLADIIKVVDQLDLNGLLLRFNHYSQPLPFADTSSIEIMFSHNPLYNDYLKNTSSGFMPKHSDYSKSTTAMFSYKLAFLGHMHWLYGKWDTDSGGTVYGLGALGRPNIEEVRDDFLQRNVPAIHWNSDTKELYVEDNLFYLPKRSDIVREDFVLRESKTETLVTNLTETLDKTQFDSPLNSLVSLVSSDTRLSSVLQSVRNGDNIVNGYRVRMQEILNKRRL